MWKLHLGEQGWLFPQVVLSLKLYFLCSNSSATRRKAVLIQKFKNNEKYLWNNIVQERRTPQ